MWLLMARERVPDAPYWPGRRGLAVVDAIGWPLGWLVLIQSVVLPMGAVGLVLPAAAIWAASRRVHRAVWANHRYRFTTAR